MTSKTAVSFGLFALALTVTSCLAAISEVKNNNPVTQKPGRFLSLPIPQKCSQSKFWNVCINYPVVNTKAHVSRYGAVRDTVYRECVEIVEIIAKRNRKTNSSIFRYFTKIYTVDQFLKIAFNARGANRNENRQLASWLVTCITGFARAVLRISTNSSVLQKFTRLQPQNRELCNNFLYAIFFTN